jgi:hypothetical protein
MFTVLLDFDRIIARTRAARKMEDYKNEDDKLCEMRNEEA